MDFVDLAEKFGLPVAGLLYAVTALYFDWVVSGKRYREVSKQRDRLLALALSGQRKVGQSLDVAEALLPTKTENPDE